MSVAGTGFSQYSSSDGAAFATINAKKTSAENVAIVKKILFAFTFYNLFFTNVLKSIIFFEFRAAGFFQSASRMSFAAS